MTDVPSLLLRLCEILRHHSGDAADWMSSLVAFAESDHQALYRELNSKRMWGGAGSIANEALADNPGMDEWSWHMEIREFRELMIELGEHLMAREDYYPDISAWIMAFSNWNQSDV